MTVACNPAIEALTLTREGLGTFVDEGMPLFRKHWEEISSFLDIPLNPDIDRYMELEFHDRLRIYTARVNGVLIGYAVFFVGFHMHYSDSLQAVQDIVFLDPAFRGLWLGVKLLRYCDEQLALEGIQLSAQHVKIKHPALKLILERIGYTATEWILVKRLDCIEATGAKRMDR